MLKTIISLCLVCTMIAVYAPVTAAEDSYACHFAGTVKAGDSDTPVGTRITAVINGDEFHTHTPISADTSTYSLTITPPDGASYPNGAEVIFKINGYEAEQTGSYFAGTEIGLNLSTATAQPIPYSLSGLTAPPDDPIAGSQGFNWGLFILLPVFVLAIVSLVYYMKLIRRIVRKRLVNSTFDD